MNNSKIPELLAPAGGLDQLKAAVNCGADAVYMGGPLFNARIRAENFTLDDMKEAVDYAHERNVSIYVTLNTLVKDRELPRALEYAASLHDAGADALILQDMGLSRLIHRYIPDMPMHLSTQGTVYSEWAVDTVREMGFSRIVPARELTIDEIGRFCAACHDGEKSCEVEVFIHGALCMCYSGQCQMSRVIGGINGRSGNRGLCAQPCRLPYTDEKGRTGYLLSPKDLCTIDHIPDLVKAGVDSFKIEGRLKSAEYVAVVTSIYRKYLDMYAETGRSDVSPEDRLDLLQIFNRGGFTDGHMYGNPVRKMLSGSSPKNMGIYAGKVRKGQTRRRDGKPGTLIDVECSAAGISMGDGVEIRGRSETGNIVTYIREVGGGLLRIGDIKKQVDPGDSVFKVTDRDLLRRAEKACEEGHAPKSKVSMTMELETGERPLLRLTEDATGISCTVRGGEELEKALKSPSDEERVARQLSKMGNTPFEAGSVDVRTDGDCVIPVKKINAMRREACDMLLAEKRDTGRKDIEKSYIDEIIDEEGLLDYGGMRFTDRDDIIYIYTREELDSLRLPRKKGVILCMPLEIFMEGDASFTENVRVVPYVLNISKGRLDAYIEENFRDIVEAVRDSGIMLGNLGWMRMFLDEGVRVYGDAGLNIYNAQSEKVFTDMGVEILRRSHELNEKERDIPLMIIEGDIGPSELRDRKDAPYRVVRSCSGDKSIIFKM